MTGLSHSDVGVPSVDMHEHVSELLEVDLMVAARVVHGERVADSLVLIT